MMPNLPNFASYNTRQIDPNYKVETWRFNLVKSENLISTNFTGTNATIDNLDVNQLTVDNLGVGTLSATGAFIQSAIINSLTGTNSSFDLVDTDIITCRQIQATGGQFQSVVTTSLTGTNATLTYLTGTNAYFTNLTCVNQTYINETIVNSTTTYETVLTLTGTNASLTNLTTTSLTGTNAAITNLTTTSLTGTNAAITNLTVNNITAPTLATVNTMNAMTYDTSSKQVGYFPYSLVPPGTVHQFAGSSAPAGYLLCDGSAVSRSTYSVLFSIIGTTYGVGDNATTFNLPNCKGKVPAGYDSAQSEFNALGKTGGEKTHTITVNELPAHNHDGSTSTVANHTHNYQDAYFAENVGGGANNVFGTNAGTDGDNSFYYRTSGGGYSTSPSDIATSAAGTHNHTFTTNDTGNGVAMNVLQPFITFNYIIKT
jgi:microcystin-dependent protein